MEPSHPEWVETLYDTLAGDNDGRVCEAISDEACVETPGNFLRTMVANALTSVGDRLASAKTTLPWLLAHLGAPAWTIGLLAPIRESGSMLPQLAIGSLIRRQAVRKWVWSAGSLGQGAAVAGMALVALTLEGLPAAFAIIALLIAFSLARGACSIAYKDVLGKTIPKTRRGRLSGWITAIAGISAMGAGSLVAWLHSRDTAFVYVIILLIGAGLWTIAAFVYATIIEEPGETGGGVNGLRESFAKLAILKTDAPFRRFVIARALALGSALAAPLYVVLAQRSLGSAASLLGIFIAVEGLAALVSAPIWGRYADRSSRMVFAIACAGASGISIAIGAWSLMGIDDGPARWIFPGAFFALGVAHAGIRLGRKTYLVDLAEGVKRTDYVSVSNTVIGAALLVSGAISALAAAFSLEGAIILLGASGLAGAALSLRWKPV